MSWPVGIVIVLMLGFAIFSAVREIRLYQKALKGQIQFLVSKSRLVRRLTVSATLIAESVYLIVGFFVLNLTDPLRALLFWTPALILILLVCYLAMRDFRETRRDIDKILLEAAHTAILKAKREMGSKSAEEPRG